MGSTLDFSPPYHNTRHRDVVDVSPDLSMIAPPIHQDKTLIAKTALQSLWRKIRGAPMVRKRHYDETAMGYRIAQFLHFYEQRGTHLMIGLFLLIFCTIAYFYYAIPAGVAFGLEVVQKAPTYSPETTAARQALSYGNELRVRNISCVSGVTTPIATELDTEAIALFPNHEHTIIYWGTILGLSTVLRHDKGLTLPCVCAPYGGFDFRLILFRHNGLVATFVNPVIVPSSDKMVVRHSQAANFDIPRSFKPIIDNTSDVMIVRHDPLYILHGIKGQNVSYTATGSMAYCIEECIDLLNGKTIWRKALDQLAEGILVNKAHESELKQYDC